MRIIDKIKISLKKLSKLKSKVSTKRFWNKRGSILRKEILHYYKNLPVSDLDDDKKEIVSYLENNKITLMPYKFVNEYLKKNVSVQYDKENGFFFINFDNKKLYYRKDWSTNKIRKYHSYLLAEQDFRSPHSYLDQNFTFNANGTLVDAGAAEGIFSLMVVERAKEIYIIEPDPLWIDALKLTFNPWKDKVTILPGKIDDNSSKGGIILDDFFKNKVVDFIKVDIEGWEKNFLASSKEILSRNYPIKIALATYHRQNDEIEFTETFLNAGYTISFSKGFILYYYDRNIDIPYLRKGLIRAQKLL